MIMVMTISWSSRMDNKMSFKKDKPDDQEYYYSDGNEFDFTPSRYFNIEQLVEVNVKDPVNFLRVRETLTRIGTQEGNTLRQICYIFYRQKRNFIVHIKELMILDGKQTDIVEEDIAKRNLIATLLSDWGLLEVKNPGAIRFPIASTNKVRIIPYKEKENWNLVSDYNIGRNKI